MENHPEYYDLQSELAFSGIGTKKKGGKVTEPSRQRYLSKNDRIAIDNNRGLHEFVKTMNQKQKEIFLKLMSI
jgi:hypothetical protein